MISLTIAFASAFLSSGSSPAEEWAVPILRQVAKNSKPLPSGRSERDERVHSVSPAIAERFATSEKVQERVGALIQTSQVSEAYRYLTELSQTRPDLKEFLVDSYIDCALLTGRYDEAYVNAATVLLDPAKQNELRYLRLALASAGKGQVEPGQMEFAREWLDKYYESRHHVKPNVTAQGGTRAKQAMVVSALALGVRGGIEMGEYLELALKLDPKNELAAQEVIEYYGYKGRYSDIRRVALSIASVLPKGKARDRFTGEAAKAATMPDKVENKTINP